MPNNENKCRIKIEKNGPYLVTGNVPLSEKIIVPKGKGYEFKEGRSLPQSSAYSLCRCGKTKNPPFCDCSHKKFNFNGEETASKAEYKDRADLMEGATIDLLDDHRCAFARFCHREKGSVWELTQDSDNKENRSEAIQAANDCPSGRLVAVDKLGNMIEPEYEPEIEIIQDPQKESSGGIFVKGNIPIESTDGDIYELRNRVVLCRCGESENKPFCDATHISIQFSDGK